MSRAVVVGLHGGVGLTTPEPHVRHVQLLLSPMLQESVGDFAVGKTEIPAYQHGSLHSHPTSAEVWLFYEGQGRAVVGDEEHAAEAGTVVYTPAGVPHQCFNDGPAPLRLFFLYCPSGEEQAILDSSFF